MLEPGDIIKARGTIEFTTKLRADDYLLDIPNGSLCIFIKHEYPFVDEITILWKNKLCFTHENNLNYFVKV